jgi:formyl-CoA transferase
MKEEETNPPPCPSSDSPAGDGPLAGLRVIELGQLLAGPYAGRLLAEMGAEVIKVEAPDHPDPLREWGHHRHQGRSLWWPVQSRNKKCITLNLREQPGQELLLDLVRHSDVVLENFRPGTLERWNLSYDVLAEANPAIILTRVSGFGQTGPHAHRAGYASVAEAVGGLRYISGFPDEPPPRMNISLGDSLAGMFATYGTLAALYQRDALGGKVGQEVDVALADSCFAFMEGALPEFDRLGIVREPHGTSLKGIAPSNIFRSRDGRWIIIAANQDTLFRRLAGAMDRPELATDERFATHLARGDNQEELDSIIAEWAVELDADEIDAQLSEAGVVVGPVQSIADIAADPQFEAREMLLEHQDPEFGRYVGPGIVPKLSRTPGRVRWSATWDQGSHNSEIYEGLLGLSKTECEALRSQGITS